MRKKIILCFIAIFSFLTLTLFGCGETAPIENFYGSYALSSVHCNYYDGDVFRNMTYINPTRDICLGSAEQNEFYRDVYDMLGTYLRFEKEYIYFNEKIPVTYTCSKIFDDGAFRFEFDNIFGTQSGDVTKYMNDGYASVSLDYKDNTVKERHISITSSLFVKGQGPLDFKPVATLKFAFSNLT